jgi:hypothetical protein
VIFNLWSERPNVLAKKRLVLLGEGSVKDGMENLGQNTGLSTDKRPQVTFYVDFASKMTLEVLRGKQYNFARKVCKRYTKSPEDDHIGSSSDSPRYP